MYLMHQSVWSLLEKMSELDWGQVSTLDITLPWRLRFTVMATKPVSIEKVTSDVSAKRNGHRNRETFNATCLELCSK
jgi:hypothetical protein